jgi:hypothetical protein
VLAAKHFLRYCAKSPLGFGYHGDFIAGWDAAFLQNAINTCRDPSGDIHACPIFTIKKRTEAQNCRFIPPKVASEENCGARRDELCGGVQIQSGPQPATSAAEPAPIANDTPTPVSPPAVKVQQVTPFAVADLPSQTRSYRTEYSTMNGKRVMVLIEETTVTDVETEFVKRSVASEASVAAHQRRHGHGHGHNRHV